MSVSENLRNLRGQQRLSQKELSDMTGVAQSTISGIERGQQNPSIETLEALASGLRCSSAKLVESTTLYDPHDTPRVLPEELMRILQKMDLNELQRVTDFAAVVLSARRN